MAQAPELADELAPLRERALDGHPWAAWASGGAGTRMPGGAEPLERRQGPVWEPLRPERVCEVTYDHMQGDRFRHAARLPSAGGPTSRRAPAGYDQLEVTPAFELAKVFGALDPPPAGAG